MKSQYRSINLLGLLLGLALLWLSALVQAATLTASVDRNVVARDETLTLTLTLSIDAHATSDPADLALLSPYFEILSNSQSTQLQIINGRSESTTEWRIELAPKRVGRILIPAFEVDGARSTPLQIDVSANSAPSSSPADDYYLELETDSPSAYVDQQLRLSLRLYTAINLNSLEAQPLQLDGADVVKLDEQQYQKVQNGRRFLVYELNYAVFPRNPGSLEIPAQRFHAIKGGSRSLFDNRRGQQIRLTSPARSLPILPVPEGIDPHAWLPATSISLNQTLSAPDGGYRVGEPITRTLNLQAEGVESNRLPQLPAPSSPAFKQYPEPAQLEQQTPASGIHASRIERYGLVPTQAGPLQLPAIELPWWDTRTQQLRIARIAAQTLDVLPARNAPSIPMPAVAAPVPQALIPPAAPISSANAGWLLWSNLLWAALCTLLAALWWRARQRTISTISPETAPRVGLQPGSATSIDEVQAFKALETACRQGDWQAIHQALQRWRHGASATPILDAELTAQSAQLDRCLYASGTLETFDAQLLLAAVRSCRQRLAESGRNPQGLPPLYR